MNASSPLPVILLAFADYRTDEELHLRELGAEQDGIVAALKAAEEAKLCKVVQIADATVKKITDAFSDYDVVVFHYGGHANGYSLLMEKAANAEELAVFLGKQPSLQLVFLNGCATGPQAKALLREGVPLVIATSKAINDTVAREFSVSFYAQLGKGKNIETAYAHYPYQYSITHKDKSEGERLRGLYFRKMPASLIERVPWDLYHTPGAEVAKEWNLPLVAGDPLFGLPPIYPIYDLPEHPFRYLKWFEPEHAEVFFGRSHQIRELFKKLTEAHMPPISLLFGKTGVGKSSLLHAGLFPRLKPAHHVEYVRRDPSLGLLGTLLQKLDGTALKEVWLEREEAESKPLIVILDQAEEVFHRPMAEVPPQAELELFTQALKTAFGDPANRPSGKLLLSYRKEYHAEIDKALSIKKIARSKTFLEPLKMADIEAAVTGIAEADRCKAQYGLTVEPGLASTIAHDLLADSRSAIAPVLQILLTNLWEAAIEEDSVHPAFTQENYRARKRQGLLLADFLDRQISWLAEQSPEAVASGLVLDILHYFTTPGGTSARQARTDLSERYSHLAEGVSKLLQDLVDAYLLVENGAEYLSLTHDTLAPLVRTRHELSDLPGQRADRLLRSAMREYLLGESSALLDLSEIRIVEKGLPGRHMLDKNEKELLAESQALAENMASKEAAEAKVLEALQLVDQDPTKSFELAKAAWSQDPTSKSFTAMHQAFYKQQFVYHNQRYASPPYREITHFDDYIDFADFHPDGQRIISASKDQMVRIWDLQGNELFHFSPHQARTYSAKFSPNGKYLVTAGAEGVAKVWEVGVEMTLLAELAHEDSVKYAEFSLNNELIVTASVDKTAKVWTLEGKLIDTMAGHSDRVNFATFTPDSRYIISVSNDQQVRVWNRFARFGVPIQMLGPPQKPKSLPIQHHDPILCCAVSSHNPFEAHSNKYLVATASFDGTVTLYKDSLAREFHTYTHGDYSRTEKADMTVLDKHTDRVHYVTFSPDGQYLVTTAWDTTIRLWDLEGTELVVLKGHEQGVFCANFSPDGRYLVSASSDGRLLLWDLQARLIEAGSHIPQEPLGNTLIGRNLFPEIHKPFPDGSGYVTYQTNNAQVYDADGKRLRELPAQRGGGVPPYLDISADGQYILLPKGMRACQVYDREGNSLCDFSGIEKAIVGAEFGESDAYVVTTYEDGMVLKWPFRI